METTESKASGSGTRPMIDPYSIRVPGLKAVESSIAELRVGHASMTEYQRGFVDGMELAANTIRIATPCA